MVLEPGYEQDFYDFSYGFRRGYSAHQAIEYMFKEVSFKKMYHIWPLGPHQPGAKPIMSVPYSQLHAVARTGRKGINISKY